MFSDEKENYMMLFGAYKKIKAYYHYNKNYLFMREKIAIFEYDDNAMKSNLSLLARVLKTPSNYSKEINQWISSIGYYVLPKTFSEDKSIEAGFVTSYLPSKSVSKVNFFIDMPIELHLLETVWTLFVSKIIQDNNIISKYSFGNVIDDKVLFDSTEKDLKNSIRFGKNNLFKIYFPQYCCWKNNAIKAIENNKKDKNTVLVSLDIKSFFYSVRWKFDMLSSLVPDIRIEEISELSDIIRLIYEQYTYKISEKRELKQNLRNKENVFPIGLFSSMLLANTYMSKFDKEMLNNANVLYYGRYVDDILLLLNTNKTGFSSDSEGLEKLLIFDNQILSKSDSGSYKLYGFHDLIVQKSKLKVVYFECGKCDGIIAQLKKTKMIPSQMNVIPNNDIQMTDFEETAYVLNNFSSETKIRELGQLEIDKFRLSSHLVELVRGSKFRLSYLPAEKKQRQQEKEKVIKFFSGSNAIEFNNNWINALYFILLSSDKQQGDWNSFEERVRNAIKKITIDHLEDIVKGKTSGIKSKMKKDLSHLFDICIATALAINPKFSKKEKKDVMELCYKIRSANLFNHYLVSFPLINYSDSIEEDIDLSNIKLSKLRKEYFDINSSRKIMLSPRFINFDELFHHSFIYSIVCKNGEMVTDSMMRDIQKLFYAVNNINELWAKPLSVCIETKRSNYNEYQFQNITLGNKKRNLERIRIAVANIKLDIDSCCMGLSETPVIRNRSDFISFMKTAYNNGEDQVDYLVFPEFYLPLTWMQDVLTFSRKTGITVISGLQYICQKNIAHNVVGVFARVKSGKYNSACVLVREKNDYSPLEKRLLATEGYSVLDKKRPIYTCVNDGRVRFGLFLCYEFTDIIARGLFKNKADIIFIPENNNDTTYFSNIIETMARDVHAFLVQANTSNYGDSRISGPFSRDYRNIVQIKGGDSDGLIIGTINIKHVRKCRIEELKEKKEVKVSKLSARTTY